MQSIADQLVNEGLLLTALELHAELSERGKPLQSLKDFFEDSNNFEQFTRAVVPPSPSPSVSSVEGIPRKRAESQVTLDSLSLLDATRFSEDSVAHSEERTAVLEFELRKARDTIHGLRKEKGFSSLSVNRAMIFHYFLFRKELTAAAAAIKKNESHSNKDGKGRSIRRTSSYSRARSEELDDDYEEEEDDDEEDDDDPEIRAHEQRALNYLVNEYLLQHGYKLTSITFSDENSEEDFEDWDAVGLNVAKPPTLLRLYRNYKQHVAPEKDLRDVACEAILEEEEDSTPFEQFETKLNALEQQLAQRDKVLEEKETKIEKLTANQAEVLEAKASLEASVASLEKKLSDIPSSAVQETVNRHVESVASPQTVSLSVPESFVALIEKNCCVLKPCEDPQLDFLSGIDVNTSSSETALDKALNVLAESLPKVLPNVLLAKRDELLPLLLLTIHLHPEASVRDQFLHMLFNLIKRPDAQQRRSIVAGFVAMASQAQFGASRIEAELLPQCWEQIAHKYDERRLLVAETCGTLMPYIPAALRSSLLLSMLSQLALEDKETEVRVSAVKSLAVLVLHLDGQDEAVAKFESVWDITTALLRHSDAPLVSCTQDTLLLSMSHWSLSLAKLESVVITDAVNDFSKHCDMAEEDTPALETRLRTLQNLIPFTIFSIMKSAPQIDMRETEPLTSNTNTPLTLDILFGSKTRCEKVRRDCQELLSREWYEAWPQLQWLKNFLLKELASTAARIPLAEHDIGGLFEKFQALCEQLVLAFGATFTRSNFAPYFESYISISFVENSVTEEETRGLGDQFLLAIYALALLRHTEAPTDLSEKLKQWIKFHVIAGYSTTALVHILRQLCKIPRYQETLSELAWSLVVHSNPKVKCFGAVLLDLLSNHSEDDLLGSKLLPGLVTLSSDSEDNVRVSALPGLATVAACSLSEVLREKAGFQLGSFFDEGHCNFVYVQVVEVLGKKWLDLPPKLREEVLLPKLVTLHSRYGNDDATSPLCNEAHQTEFSHALLTTYQRISSSALSVQSVQTHLRPSLEKLLKDIRELVPGLTDSVQNLIRQLEEAYGVAFEHSGPPEGASGTNLAAPAHSMVSKMSHSPSLDEVKQRMGKLFNRPGTGEAGSHVNAAPSSGVKMQFWKKSS